MESEIRGFINDRSRLAKAKRILYGYVKSQDETPVEFSIDDIHVVWFCKTLQNWKAILITTLPDQMIYDITYNGDNQEAYLDAYSKVDNQVFKDG